MEEEPLVTAEALYHLNGKKTGSWGIFCFYETELIIYKGSQLKKVGGAFGASGAVAAHVADRIKQRNNPPAFTISYIEIEQFMIDKSLLFGNGIKVVLPDKSSIKMDLPPKYFYEKLAAIVAHDNPEAVK